MTSRVSRIVRAAFVAALLGSTILVPTPTPARAQSADVLSSIVSGGQNGKACSGNIANAMTSNLRKALNSAADRFAASLFPPGSTDGMGCLSNITSLFSNVKSIFSGQSGFDLNSVMSQMGGGITNAVSSAICGFARAAVSSALKSLANGISGGGGSMNYGSMPNQSWSSIATSLTPSSSTSSTSGGSSSGTDTSAATSQASALYNQLVQQGLQPSVNAQGQTVVTTSNGTTLTFNSDGSVSATTQQPTGSASGATSATTSPTVTTTGTGVLIGSGVSAPVSTTGQ